MDSELITLFAGASGAAVIKLVDGIIQYCLSRRAKKFDDKTQTDKDQDAQMAALRNGMRVIMLDRIQYLCKCYIADGEVDFDDRRRLHLMHKVYHDELNGNGDLDLLMKDVDKLPLKQKGD